MNDPTAHLEGPTPNAGQDCERVLRTLPQWFGIERSLLAYAASTERLPTFVARDDNGRVIGFISVARRARQGWELHCMAVDAAYRRRGVGRRLHRHAVRWLAASGARALEVKALDAGGHLPLLQLVKPIEG
jgi:GNAT superfamily N-acetyltransferase